MEQGFSSVQFLDLPRECRDLVYRSAHAVAPRQLTVCICEHSPWEECTPHLLQKSSLINKRGFFLIFPLQFTCRQLYRECTEALSSSTVQITANSYARFYDLLLDQLVQQKPRAKEFGLLYLDRLVIFHEVACRGTQEGQPCCSVDVNFNSIFNPIACIWEEIGLDVCEREENLAYVLTLRRRNMNPIMIWEKQTDQRRWKINQCMDDLREAESQGMRRLLSAKRR